MRDPRVWGQPRKRGAYQGGIAGAGKLGAAAARGAGGVCGGKVYRDGEGRRFRWLQSAMCLSTNQLKRQGPDGGRAAETGCAGRGTLTLSAGDGVGAGDWARAADGDGEGRGRGGVAAEVGGLRDRSGVSDTSTAGLGGGCCGGRRGANALSEAGRQKDAARPRDRGPLPVRGGVCPRKRLVPG